MPSDIVIGGNVFYDATTGTNSMLNPFGEGVHRRYSTGGTIITSQAGAFFNIYKGISEAIGGCKVSDGYDLGVSGLVPRFESINLGASKYSCSDVNEGTKFKIEYKPNSLFTLGVEKTQSDTSSTSLYIETKYKFNTPLEEQLAISTKIARNVWDKRYGAVERDNAITLDLMEAEDGKLLSPATVGTGEYNKQTKSDGHVEDGEEVFTVAQLPVIAEAIGFNSNDQGVTYAGENIYVNDDGKPWELDYVEIERELKGKNCVVWNDNGTTTFFVRKGMSCSIDVTFTASDIYRAKTEILRLYADAN